MAQNARGEIFIHSATAALCPHIEWAISAVVGAPVALEWTPQGAQPGTMRAESIWEGDEGVCARIVSALMRCHRLRFEVTSQARPGGFGERYSYTPALGVFHAVTDEFGDIQVSENRLRAALSERGSGGRDVREAIDALLGASWDDELEIFRHAGDEAPVRWLHRAV
mgnify:FL=1